MKLILVLLALILGQLCFADDPSDKIKNITGPGRYHGSGHRRRHDDYSREKHYRAPVIDDYICDLEATILVVSSKHHVKEEKSYGGKSESSYGGQQQYGGENQQYGGGNSYGGQQQSYSPPQYGNGPYRTKRNAYGAPPPQQSYDQNSYGGGQQYGGQQYGENSPSYGGGKEYDEKPKRHEYAIPEALRLKCSHIAIHSEHDCHTCCQLSARRYHSVSKHDIFGFIVDASEIKHEGEKSYVRSKRNAGSAPPSSYGSAPAPGYEAPAPAYEAPAPAYDNNYSSAPETPAYSPDASYPAAKESYGSSHEHYGARTPRCVCCSPKRHHEGHHHYRKHDRYDRSDSHSHEY